MRVGKSERRWSHRASRVCVPTNRKGVGSKWSLAWRAAGKKNSEGGPASSPASQEEGDRAIRWKWMNRNEMELRIWVILKRHRCPKWRTRHFLPMPSSLAKHHGVSSRICKVMLSEGPVLNICNYIENIIMISFCFFLLRSFCYHLPFICCSQHYVTWGRFSFFMYLTQLPASIAT